MLAKETLLEKAIEITKEYVRGGGTIRAENVLEAVYKKLEELNRD